MNSDYKYVYESPLDIYSFFRNKETIRDFIIFFFENAVEFSKKIEDAGDDYPYPVQYSSRGYHYQTDYQFFIYIVAKWVAKLTNDKGKMASVLREFAITKMSLTSETRKKNRIGFSFFMGETLGLIINRVKGKKYSGKNSTNIDYYSSFMSKIDYYNGNHFVIKMIAFDTYQLKYYWSEWEKFEEENEEFLRQNESDQRAFHMPMVNKLSAKLEEDGTPPIMMFSIFDDDINGDISEIEKRNVNLSYYKE